MVRFDAVGQLGRLALRRHHVVPAPRHHGRGGKTEHAIGDGIAMVVVIKQPRVHVPLAQRSLNFREIHRQMTIVNCGRDLRDCGAVSNSPRSHRDTEKSNPDAFSPGSPWLGGAEGAHIAMVTPARARVTWWSSLAPSPRRRTGPTVR